jgi:hypothetical protein
MTNYFPNGQAVPAIPVMMTRGRHRRKRKIVVQSHGSQKSGGVVPEAIPPHPPLVSGGWYRGFMEVLGPGRYPLDSPPERSVGAALALSLLGGPLGVFYVSLIGGLVCVTVASVAILVFGVKALFVVWPLSMIWAGIGSSRRRATY